MSRDEEYVRLELRADGASLDFGARRHNFLLLTLARRRLADDVPGLPETSRGWAHADELRYEPNMTRTRLNLDVHRIRRAFLSYGLVDGADIIERRTGCGQLRLGTGRVSIAAV